MKVFKSFRLFGLYFYVSSVCMKKRSPSEERWRNHRAFRQRAQLTLVRRQEGCCAKCGRKLFGDNGFGEMHHVLPVSERPDLALDLDNLVLLCHDCHVELHRKTAPRGEN